ncbi:acetoacetate decarboxylase family protein [Streptomyces sp. NBC_01275]|uniref:acetoacetate decarboxylase family protein n=1 Tax=Streptomyces sp. NBC_01275 TaxID=2903807 RepID=UPI0022550B5E|nr:acetoacetate decarboxylase family protein [Streptomyces sp. NBC_01275]MCX4765913.1 acetoacetate decarboxylase family protein [Streptomyces sp. NBC_01275]
MVAVAEGIREVSARTTAVLLDGEFRAAARRRPRTGLPAQWATLRVLTGRQGLGCAITADRGVGRRLGQGGEILGRESLAALVAVTSLRLRIGAVVLDHPELARHPGMRRLMDAVTADRDLASLRALRALFKDQGAQQALSALAPVMAELLAIRALLDEDPMNDETGWALATGRMLSADPIKGINTSYVCELDRGEGAADPVELTEHELQRLSGQGSFLGFLRNIDLLSTDGRVLLQDVRGPDGVVRHVLHAPGMAPGRPRNDSPQDFVGAWRNLFMTDSPYTRAILLAVAHYGIPRGADVALIGHSEGGIAVMNLAQSEEFSRAYRVTHAVAVGSPVDNKKPADPRTWAATITNQHDIVPVLDGRGAGTAFDPHPDWYEVDYTGPTHEFPLSHMLGTYIEDLEKVIPDAARHVDEALAPYRGEVLRTQCYQLRDRANPPQGYPFLTVPTAPVTTSAGPVDTPVRYYDSTAAHAFFTVDADAARSLLPDVTWMVPARLGRRALAVLSGYEHRCTTIGPYSEISLSLIVNDLWRPKPYDLALDLMRRTDLRRTGRYVVGLTVSTEEARAAAEEIWGQRASVSPVDVDLLGRDIGVGAQEPGIRLTGELGPGTRCPDADWALYGRRGERTLRIQVRSHGRPRIHPAPRVRLEVGTRAHPLAEQLRRLGLDSARPRSVLTSHAFMSHRSAGAELR